MLSTSTSAPFLRSRNIEDANCEPCARSGPWFLAQRRYRIADSRLRWRCPSTRAVPKEPGPRSRQVTAPKVASLQPFLPHILHDVAGEHSVETSAIQRLVELSQTRRPAAVLLAIGQALNVGKLPDTACRIDLRGDDADATQNRARSVARGSSVAALVGAFTPMGGLASCSGTWRASRFRPRSHPEVQSSKNSSRRWIPDGSRHCAHHLGIHPGLDRRIQPLV
jgi:hypothetical protein